MAETTVIHINRAKRDPQEVYIGRPGIFGNPIAIGKPCPMCGQTHDRGGTLICYEQYLLEKIEEDDNFRAAVKGLHGKTLVCFCKPLPCHGDILAAMADLLNH